MAPRENKEWLYDRDGEGSSRERWLVTYADLITLLLVFFIVMYALSSRISGEKFDQLASSLATSMKKTRVPKPSDRTAFSKDLSKEQRQFKATADAVVESLVKTDPKSDVKIDIDERGLVVSLIDTSFFDAGSAVLKPSAYKTLLAVTKPFHKLKNDLRIEGHSDSSPVHSVKFPSNWELSTSRATSVVRFLIDTGHFSSTRIHAAGFADNKPVASNGTAEGRKRNRRVEIIVLKPQEDQPLGAGLPMQPSAAPATAAPAPHHKGFPNPFQ
ncbi:MAG: motB [Cyanobacteria bacterium RYN_339]|nr:motB [Cyanobacteria bacterium RYN_339]